MEGKFVTYTACPCCGSLVLHKALVAKDNLVSEKEFEIWQCADCTLRFTQNVPDENTISEFYQSADYISHSGTNKGAINRLYHFVRKLTLADKRRLILSVTQIDNGSLLDIGAGTGAFVSHMQSNGWQATGLEPDEAARQNALAVNKVNLLTPDALFAFPADSFEVITLWHVLEHIHNLHDYVEQLKKILKPGGNIFIAVPNYTSYDGGFYKGFWAAYDVPRHLYHFSPEAMFQLLGMHNLQLLATRVMWYDSFYISLLSEKYKKKSNSLIRGIFVALISNLQAFVDKERCSSLIYIVGK
ncbi:MAG TPA: class I SAM-dependent methyltransferase [Puia sp.]|jgi:2-polyprenyl-3-methyl-5-hydroxy-6-metoxy-1,4-benzoquinol methylase|nr:class I SAM-dependent methyltransferase [Puia sp.]